MKVFLDSDVLIWLLRGDKRAARLLKDLRTSPACELWTGALQRAEILFYARPEEEKPTMKLLSILRTASVTEDVVDSAAIMFRKWRPSHDLGIVDVILAATSVKASGKVVTLNTKHFPMPEVTVERAWKA